MKKKLDGVISLRLWHKIYETMTFLEVTFWILVAFYLHRKPLVDTVLQVLRPIRRSNYSLDFSLGVA